MGRTKPNGYWTKERCHEEALKYKTISDLQKGNGTVCYVARKEGFMEEICSHMERLIKPNNYWNKERCHEVALKYESRVEFQKKDPSVYQAARSKGFLDEICGHMKRLLVPNDYWTEERCHSEALKYTKRVDFQRKSNKAYNAAKRRGIMDKICVHMKYVCTPSDKIDYDLHKRTALQYTTRRDLVKDHPSIYSTIIRKGWNELLEHMEYIFLPNGYWTKEKVMEVALKYENLKEFRENNCGAYNAMYKNGWKEELCHHILNSPTNWSIKENCRRVASECRTRTEFQKKFPGAACQSRKKGWIDELCEHMGPKSSIRERYIYAYEFEDNHVYVGLTCNPYKRNFDHFKDKRVNSAVRNHWLKTGMDYKLVMVYQQSFDMNLASEKEREAVEMYRNKGWAMLNRVRAGSLGGSKKIWTEEKFLREAAKHKAYSELRDNIKPHVLKLGIKNGWLEKSGLIDDRPHKWTREEAFEMAKRYNSTVEMQKKHNGLYKYLKREGILEEAMSHKVVRVPYSQRYTFEECTEACARFNTKIEFKENEYEMYECSHRNGWLKKMKNKLQIERELNPRPKLVTGRNRERVFHDLENVIEIAGNYQKRSEFKNEHPVLFKKVIKSCYRKVRQRILGHMKNDLDGRSKRKSIWIYEKCLEESKKYDSRWAFRKGCKAAYEQSTKNGWIAEFFPEIKKVKSKWTYEMCLEESKKYKTRIEFIKGSKTAYVNAFKNGWIDDFIPPHRKQKAKLNQDGI